MSNVKIQEPKPKTQNAKQERDPSIKMSIQTDEHSPDKFRVNGPLSQVRCRANMAHIRPSRPDSGLGAAHRDKSREWNVSKQNWNLF